MNNNTELPIQNEESIALQEFVRYAEEDIKAGRVMSSDSFKEYLSLRKANLTGECYEQ